MPFPARLLRAATVLVFVSLTRAQVGVLDQVSPIPGGGQTANFAVSNPAHRWQQQVRAGIAGTLGGIELRLTGPVGASAIVRVRRGAGWSAQPILFQTTVQKSVASTEQVFVDASSAHIQLALGERFVLELAGNGTLAGVDGSYTPASQGAPQYGEPLFLDGPGCYAGCRWRIGFATYVLTSGATETCFGNGCPCGNDAGAAGCRNSTGVGARLSRASGTTSVAADDLVLVATQLPKNVSTLVFAGAAAPPVPFGDGLRCSGAPVRRYALVSSGQLGTVTFAHPAMHPSGAALPGSVWVYQAWYRDPTGPCARGVNLTSAVRVDFTP